MITKEELQKYYDLLYVYDVEQKGWEQEPNGIQANLSHTLTHLVKDAYRKDFLNSQLVQEAIAPDNLMYALRFVRWGKLDLDEVFRLVNKSEINDPKLLHAKATDTIADILHEEDHASSSVQAKTERATKLTSAVVLLTASATNHSEKFNFNLVDAFIDRLHQLRIRFGIPEPSLYR